MQCNQPSNWKEAISYTADYADLPEAWRHYDRGPKFVWLTSTGAGAVEELVDDMCARSAVTSLRSPVISSCIERTYAQSLSTWLESPLASGPSRPGLGRDKLWLLE